VKADVPKFARPATRQAAMFDSQIYHATYFWIILDAKTSDSFLVACHVLDSYARNSHPQKLRVVVREKQSLVFLATQDVFASR
jgi:hypothetical protein